MRPLLKWSFGSALVLGGGAVSAYFATRPPALDRDLQRLAEVSPVALGKEPTRLKIGEREALWPRDHYFLDEWVERERTSSKQGYYVETGGAISKQQFWVTPYQREGVRAVSALPFFEFWPSGTPVPQEPTMLIEVRDFHPRSQRTQEIGGCSSVHSSGACYVLTDVAKKKAPILTETFLASTFNVSPLQQQIGSKVNDISRELTGILQRRGWTLETLLRTHFERHELAHVASSTRFLPEIVVFASKLPGSPEAPNLESVLSQMNELISELESAREFLNEKDDDWQRAFCLMQIIFSIKGDWAIDSAPINLCYGSSYSPDGAIFLKHSRRDAQGHWQFDFAAIQKDITTSVKFIQEMQKDFAVKYIHPVAMKHFGINTAAELEARVAREVATRKTERGYNEKEARLSFWSEFLDALKPEEWQSIWKRAFLNDAANFQRDLAALIGYETVDMKSNRLSPAIYHTSLLQAFPR